MRSKSKYPQIRRPATMPKPPRYILRTELEDGKVDQVGTGHALTEEIDAANSYAARTKRKTWLVDTDTGRTVHRIERKALTAGGAQ